MEYLSLADNRPVVRTNDKDEPEVSILRRDEAAYGEDSLKESSSMARMSCSH